MIIKIELPKLWDIYIHEIFTNSIRLGVHSGIILKFAQVNENISSICITKSVRFVKVILAVRDFCLIYSKIA